MDQSNIPRRDNAPALRKVYVKPVLRELGPGSAEHEIARKAIAAKLRGGG